MGQVESVNVAEPRRVAAKSGTSGIDKRAVSVRVAVRPPGPKPDGEGSGLVGDTVWHRDHHGGDDQAVYAYAREDLAWWEPQLDAELRCGQFGENLTTVGVDVTQALIGETWRIGPQLVLQVTNPRIPCGTFQTWMDRPGWVKTFAVAARPGAYLRVLTAGDVGAGDSIVVSRPDHEVTVGMVFRAITREPGLLPQLLTAEEHLTEDVRLRARNREPFPGF